MQSYSVKAVLSAVDKNFSSTFEACNNAAKGFREKMKSGLGMGIAMAAGQKLFGALDTGFRAAVSAGSDFEQATSQIAATMGKPKEEIADIIEKAQEMGEATAFTATQAAEGFNILAMSGLDAEQQIAAIGDVLNLASAGAESMDASASQIVGTLKGWGLATTDVVDGMTATSKVADLVAKGASIASTDVSGLGNALSSASATAAGYGQSMDSVTVSLLRLAEQNITGEEAATALNRAMADIYTPTSSAAKALKKLGISAYTSTGQARDFNEVVGELDAALDGYSDEQANALKNTIFTTYGLSAFNKMTATSEEKVKKFADALSGSAGTAAEMAATQMDNLKGDITLLGSAVEGLEVTAFNMISDGARGAVKWVTRLVTNINQGLKSEEFKSFAESAKKYFDIFITDVKEVGRAFGDAAGAVMDSMAELNGSFGSSESVSSFASGMDAVTGALKGAAGFIKDHSDQIAWLISQLPKLAAGFALLKVAGIAAPFLSTLGGALILVGKGAAGIGGKLLNMIPGFGRVGEAASQSGKKTMQAAQAFALTAAGIFLIAGAFALLAQSSIALASAGPGAIAVMAGLAAALAGMIVLMASMAKSLAMISPKKLTSVSVAFLAMGAAVVLVAAGFALLAHSAIALSDAGIGAVATFALMAAGAGVLMAVMATFAPALTGTAAGLLAMGAAVVLVAAGFYILASAAVMLGNAGTPAMAAMAGLAGGLLMLMAAMAILGPALTAASVGMLAFGAAVLMAGAGAMMAGIGMAILAGALPVITEYGIAGAAAITMIGASLVAFAAGAALAGAGAVVLAAGLTALAAGSVLAAAGIAVLGAGVLVLAAGMAIAALSIALIASSLPGISANAQIAAIGLAGLSLSILSVSGSATAFEAILAAVTLTMVAFDASMAAGAVSTAAMALALVAVTAEMASISSNATDACASISQMETSVNVVKAALSTISSLADSAMSALISAFSGAEGTVVSSARSMADGVTTAITDGLRPIPAETDNVMSQMAAGFSKASVKTIAISAGMSVAVIAAFNNMGSSVVVISAKMMAGYTASLQAGGARSIGIASGMTASIIAIFASGQAGAYRSGMNIGLGLANGMQSQVSRVRSAAASLANASTAAINAAAKVHSPSRISTWSGEMVGQGYIDGIRNKIRKAKEIAGELFSTGDMTSGRLDGASAMLSEIYSYDSSGTITVDVPLYINDREIARATAEATHDVQARYDRNLNRQSGRR